MSVVANGPLAGQTLHELFEKSPESLAGSALKTSVFPLLIKILDARRRLSLQVHPNNETAPLTGGEAKTEMWYMLDNLPEARVFAGLKHGTDETAFRRAMDNGTLEEVLNLEPVRSGDAIYVPGGRVHAIDSGCLLLEVQQCSDTTYRVHDWGRVGNDGNPRPLHVEQALKVIDWNNRESPLLTISPLRTSGKNTWSKVLHCPYFHIERVNLREPESVVHDGRSFHALFNLSRHLRIDADTGSETIGPGTSCLMPASLRSYTLSPTEQLATTMVISLGE